jgi:hypothetical protein
MATVFKHVTSKTTIASVVHTADGWLVSATAFGFTISFDGEQTVIERGEKRAEVDMEQEDLIRFCAAIDRGDIPAALKIFRQVQLLLDCIQEGDTQ